MCDPVTGTAIALTAASGATSAYGQVQAGKAKSRAARYEAQVADINAQYADRDARDALERGELDALAHGRQVAKTRGEQTASMAAQGLELGYGSPLDVVTDTDLLAAEDRGRIYENAEREAQSYRIKASNYRSSARGSRLAASAAMSGAYIGAGSTLLGTAAQAFGQYKGK